MIRLQRWEDSDESFISTRVVNHLILCVNAFFFCGVIAVEFLLANKCCCEITGSFGRRNLCLNL